MGNKVIDSTREKAKRRAEGRCLDCGKPRSPDRARCTSCLAWATARQLRASRRRRERVLEHYGARCACCGEAMYEFLTIDHVNGDGAAHRRTMPSGGLCIWLERNGYPDGFQVLCWNCNTAKSFHGGCPHQS